MSYELSTQRGGREWVADEENQAVKKFHEVARWARGLTPMQFDAIFRSPPRLNAKRSKSSLKTKSVQVSPPPENRTTTPYTFTERQKAFIGPHHLSKILGQKPPINH